MSSAHRREKKPQLVRQSLIEHAGRLAAEKGFAAVGVQQIAEAAGVTKGGFFHHFPSKQALIDGVVAELMASLDAEIEARLDADTSAHGRFTRAYLETVLAGDAQDDSWAPVWVSMITDPGMKKTWIQWFNTRLEKHAATDTGAHLEAVRFAADGLWLGQLVGVLPVDRRVLGAHLLELTRLQP